MLYEDKFGRIMHSDQVDDLSAWQIEELELHVYSDPVV